MVVRIQAGPRAAATWGSLLVSCVTSLTLSLFIRNMPSNALWSGCSPWSRRWVPGTQQ